MKNLYLILDITPEATPEEVRKAYRRLAKKYHPDCGEGNPERFREVRNAYEVLADPKKRRAYNHEINVSRPPPTSIFEERAVDLGLDFATHSPSFETLLDYFLRRFMGLVGKSGSKEHLAVEIILSRQEAARGGVLPLEVPLIVECPACEGTGETMLLMCPRCDGTGAMQSRRSFPVAIPAGVRDATTFDHDLEPIGIPDTVLHVVLRVR